MNPNLFKLQVVREIPFWLGFLLGAVKELSEVHWDVAVSFERSGSVAKKGPYSLAFHQRISTGIRPF